MSNNSRSLFQIDHVATTEHRFENEIQSLPFNFLKKEASTCQPRQSPPFRVGGRGSKQLSKAIEKSNAYSHIDDQSLVIFTGNKKLSPCFAKIKSTNDPSSVVIEPMHPYPGVNGFLQPWNGHISIVDNSSVLPVKMKSVQLGPAGKGYCPIDSLRLRSIIASIEKIYGKSSHLNLGNIKGIQTDSPLDNSWDVISLESSDFDDSSVESSLFPMLIAHEETVLNNAISTNVNANVNVDVNVNTTQMPSPQVLPSHVRQQHAIQSIYGKRRRMSGSLSYEEQIHREDNGNGNGNDSNSQLCTSSSVSPVTVISTHSAQKLSIHSHSHRLLPCEGESVGEVRTGHTTSVSSTTITNQTRSIAQTSTDQNNIKSVFDSDCDSTVEFGESRQLQLQQHQQQSPVRPRSNNSYTVGVRSTTPQLSRHSTPLRTDDTASASPLSKTCNGLEGVGYRHRQWSVTNPNSIFTDNLHRKEKRKNSISSSGDMSTTCTDDNDLQYHCEANVVTSGSQSQTQLQTHGVTSSTVTMDLDGDMTSTVSHISMSSSIHYEMEDQTYGTESESASVAMATTTAIIPIPISDEHSSVNFTLCTHEVNNTSTTNTSASISTTTQINHQMICNNDNDNDKDNSVCDSEWIPSDIMSVTKMSAFDKFVSDSMSGSASIPVSMSGSGDTMVARCHLIMEISPPPPSPLVVAEAVEAVVVDTIGTATGATTIIGTVIMDSERSDSFVSIDCIDNTYNDDESKLFCVYSDDSDDYNMSCEIPLKSSFPTDAPIDVIDIDTSQAQSVSLPLPLPLSLLTSLSILSSPLSMSMRGNNGTVEESDQNKNKNDTNSRMNVIKSNSHHMNVTDNDKLENEIISAAAAVATITTYDISSDHFQYEYSSMCNNPLSKKALPIETMTNTIDVDVEAADLDLDKEQSETSPLQEAELQHSNNITFNNINCSITNMTSTTILDDNNKDNNTVMMSMVTEEEDANTTPIATITSTSADTDIDTTIIDAVATGSVNIMYISPLIEGSIGYNMSSSNSSSMESIEDISEQQNVHDSIDTTSTTTTNNNSNNNNNNNELQESIIPISTEVDTTTNLTHPIVILPSTKKNKRKINNDKSDKSSNNNNNNDNSSINISTNYSSVSLVNVNVNNNKDIRMRLTPIPIPIPTPDIKSSSPCHDNNDDDTITDNNNNNNTNTSTRNNGTTIRRDLIESVVNASKETMTPPVTMSLTDRRMKMNRDREHPTDVTDTTTTTTTAPMTSPMIMKRLDVMAARRLDAMGGGAATVPCSDNSGTSRTGCYATDTVTPVAVHRSGNKRDTDRVRNSTRGRNRKAPIAEMTSPTTFRSPDAEDTVRPRPRPTNTVVARSNNSDGIVHTPIVTDGSGRHRANVSSSSSSSSSSNSSSSKRPKRDIVKVESDSTDCLGQWPSRRQSAAMGSWTL